MAVLSVYPTPDEPPRTKQEAERAAKENRVWCVNHHKWCWQERKHNGFWSYWCPTCLEWR